FNSTQITNFAAAINESPAQADSPPNAFFARHRKNTRRTASEELDDGKNLARAAGELRYVDRKPARSRLASKTACPTLRFTARKLSQALQYALDFLERIVIMQRHSDPLHSVRIGGIFDTLAPFRRVDIEALPQVFAQLQRRNVINAEARHGARQPRIV